MQLKDYQQQALEQLERWLDALKKARLNSEKFSKLCEEQGIAIHREIQNYPLSAWDTLKKQNLLPRIQQQDGNSETPNYIPRTASSGEPIPHVCLKIPTGGGKTLLGVAALERIKQDTGFVLWIVPTKAIYQQTITAFRTREHPYREMLERISGGKVKLLQKGDRFTQQDIESQLCVMMLMLPAANRQKGRDFLKIFRDSSGYTSFFPEQDDAGANITLSQQHPDLEKNQTGDWVKQSLINTLKLIRPTVILDEAHKAYGKNDARSTEFVKSVNRLNPRFVVELSATPKIGISNILVDISGTALQDEEMIKLPIELRSFSNSDWKYTLAETQKKLAELEQDVKKWQHHGGDYIRPIALVRVQRTGEGQRKLGYIHSEDVREYLIQNLSVPEQHIRIQSSKQKELAGENLLSETSPVRWIITKDALKEGWDCSFAYLLALLDNTKAITAMTQMVGRIMRQPYARRIKKSEALNQCYVYCYNMDVGEAVEGVRAGLENEGLTGLANAIHGYGGEDPPERLTVKRRNQYKNLDIFLPQVLHREGDRWRPIDYDRDILSAVDWGKISGGHAVNLDDEDVVRECKTTIDIQGQGEVSEERFDTGESLTLDYFVRRLTDMIPNPWQAARAAENFIQKHDNLQQGESKLLNNRIYLSEVLRRRVKRDIDCKAEAVFRDKVGRNQIRFHLVADKQLNYELNKQFEVVVSGDARSLQGSHGKSIQRSLFEPIYENNFNGLEKDFALYLEKSDAIYWWHRIAARQAYSLQGWRRHRVYPDFVACKKDDGTLLILETKGTHLQGNEDTTYKKNLLETLEEMCKTGVERGSINLMDQPAPFKDLKHNHFTLEMIFEDTFKEDLANIL